MLFRDYPPPPAPGISIEEYLQSIGAVNVWLSWDWLWEQHIRAYLELPQPKRYGIVVSGPLRHRGGEDVYVFPIELLNKEIIGEEFKGHRRAFERLADLSEPEESLSFALLTVMMSLSESPRVYRSQLSHEQYERFELFTAALRAYFDVHHLWHHATRRYTFTGFSSPYLFDEGEAALVANIDLLRQWVLMRWHIWCSEIGIGYPQSVVDQIKPDYWLNLNSDLLELEPLS
jgi:hypothetical protein